MEPDRTSSTRRRVLAAVGGLLGGGCTTREPAGGSPNDSASNRSSPNATNATNSSESEVQENWLPTAESPLEADIASTELVVNLDVPWDLAFTSTGELFVTERTGTLLRFETEDVLAVADDEVGPLDATSVPETDRYRGLGDHLLGVTPHPDFPDPSLLYVYSTITDGEESYNRVLRYDPRAEEPEATIEVLVDRLEGDYTIGGRLEFGPEGDLWVPIGTKTEDVAQDPAVLGGSVLRLAPDGTPAAANPSLGADADPRTFTYGHRNPQGIAWLPNGVPLVTDHGPTGRDEINRLSPGANYGWPRAQDESGYVDRPEYERPLLNTGPDETWAPSGCVLYTGDAVPEWRSRLLVATLQRRDLAIVTLRPPDADQPPLDGESTRYDMEWLDETYTATAHHVLEDEFGRLRNVAQAPDGTVLASSSNRDGLADEDPRDEDDVLVRLTSA